MAVIYYTESIPVTASSGNAAAAATNVTLPGVSGKTTYITGFTVTGAGATGASIIQVQVTNTVGGNMVFDLVIPAGVTTSITPLQVNFPLPIPATATNTGISVVVPSFGTGNTNAATVAYGYQK